MDANSIITIISTLGFPIFCCLALGYYVKTQTDLFRQDTRDMQKEHKEEVAKFTEALNSNTLVLQKLVDKIDQLDNN